MTLVIDALTAKVTEEHRQNRGIEAVVRAPDGEHSLDDDARYQRLIERTTAIQRLRTYADPERRHSTNAAVLLDDAFVYADLRRRAQWIDHAEIECGRLLWLPRGHQGACVDPRRGPCTLGTPQHQTARALEFFIAEARRVAGLGSRTAGRSRQRAA